MAIKISGVNVIDDNRNLNVGVATVGSGNSAISLSSNSLIIGIGVTIISSSINAAGIITAAGISYPLGLG